MNKYGHAKVLVCSLPLATKMTNPGVSGVSGTTTPPSPGRPLPSGLLSTMSGTANRLRGGVGSGVGSSVGGADVVGPGVAPLDADMLLVLLNAVEGVTGATAGSSADIAAKRADRTSWPSAARPGAFRSGYGRNGWIMVTVLVGVNAEDGDEGWSPEADAEEISELAPDEASGETESASNPPGSAAAPPPPPAPATGPAAPGLPAPSPTPTPASTPTTLAAVDMYVLFVVEFLIVILPVDDGLELGLNDCLLDATKAVEATDVALAGWLDEVGLAGNDVAFESDVGCVVRPGLAAATKPEEETPATPRRVPFSGIKGSPP
ncbi:MAG: hypothetical protein M1832_000474 [Thelocarpon impressellum]|nr:MAG: hypothetical protein M1832_000474 [Thelocarpon impressellum]